MKNNPDIEKFMGQGELYFGYKLDEYQNSMMLRNNLCFSDNQGAVQRVCSFPPNDYFRDFCHYLYDHEENLIDYNASVNRISMGVMLTDRL
ncbi:phospholipase A [Endozoicomonas sp. ALB032]|uniref:phospholipase A n=1 Tax=Endozoicomonas sp. ALB032 TaxID=3403082 RepID=UPI003BB7C7CB